MVAVRFEPAVERKLEELSRRTGHSKSALVRAAVQQFLEDREDYEQAMKVLKRNESTITLDELERRLGLDR